MKFRVFVVVAAILLLPATRVVAQNSDKDKDAKSEKPAEKCDAAATKEEVSTTDHTIRIGGQNIAYKATASTTLLKNDKGDATGLLYSVAYTRSDVKDLVDAADFVFVQRRAGVGDDVAAHGRVWAAARADGGWAVHAAGAVQAGG